MPATYESILREAAKKSSGNKKLGKTWPALVVLVLSLCASVVVWQVVDSAVEAEQKRTFVKAEEVVESRLQKAFEKNEDILRSMRGLYQSYPFVVRDVFELYGSIPVSARPDIKALSFLPAVDPAKVNDFVFFAQSERYFEYTYQGSATRPSVLYPVFYTVPLSGNDRFMGYEATANAELSAGIAKAIQADSMVKTVQVLLPGERDSSFFMLLPVPAKVGTETSFMPAGSPVKGVLALALHTKSFFAEAFSAKVPSDTTIYLEIREKQTGALIYTSDNYAAYVPGSYRPLYTHDHDLEFYGNTFVLTFRTVPNYGGALASNLPLLSLIGSVVTSILLTGFVYSLLTSRARAEDLAERATRAQRRIVDTSLDIICVSGLDGEYKTMNPASTAILGMSPSDIVGTSLYAGMDKDTAQDIAEKIAAVTSEQTLRWDAYITRNDGQGRWLSFSSTVSPDDGLVYHIARDVTDQKKAEQEIRLRSKQVELSRQLAIESEQFKSKFMEQISFFFRTSLTGIKGYLQLVDSGLYSDEEEKASFIHSAHTSSEELLSRVSDLIDVAEGETAGSVRSIVHPAKCGLRSTLGSIAQVVESNKEVSRSIAFTFGEESDSFDLFLDSALFSRAFTDLIEACTYGLRQAQVECMVEVNSYESVVEVQMLFPHSEKVEALIKVLRDANTETLVDILAYDEGDVLFRILEAMSKVKMVNGNLVVESLGAEGVVSMLTLPAKKVLSLKQFKRTI